MEGDLHADRQYRTIGEQADRAERYLLGLTPRRAPREAGVLSDDFWLKNV